MYCADYRITTIASNYKSTGHSEEHYWQWTKRGAFLASCYCGPSILRWPKYPSTASMIIKGVLKQWPEITESGKKLQNEVHSWILISKHGPPHVPLKGSPTWKLLIHYLPCELNLEQLQTLVAWIPVHAAWSLRLVTLHTFMWRGCQM
jgi:hypothetical protein